MFHTFGYYVTISYDYKTRQPNKIKKKLLHLFCEYTNPQIKGCLVIEMVHIAVLTSYEKR